MPRGIHIRSFSFRKTSLLAVNVTDSYLELVEKNSAVCLGVETYCLEVVVGDDSLICGVSSVLILNELAVYECPVAVCILNVSLENGVLLGSAVAVAVIHNGRGITAAPVRSAGPSEARLGGSTDSTVEITDEELNELSRLIDERLAQLRKER